jgi:hypothetical protein
VLGNGDTVILDFGEYCVGHLLFSIAPQGSPQDAPVRLRFTMGETPAEAAEDFNLYAGQLSRSWLQEEVIHIDAIPADIRLPRRYAFRYVKIEVLAVSRKYRVRFLDLRCDCVSSGDPKAVAALPERFPRALWEIDRVAVYTLRACMHTVFEVGPKRDRRLWAGDLRLQALTNYQTFQNNLLVKRCLYLFAGCALPDGRVPACVFERPKPIPDDTVLLDYSLLYAVTLFEYYENTLDRETALDLWPVALAQIAGAAARMDQDGLLARGEGWWCFIDWHEALEKRGAAQGVLICALKGALAFARSLGLEDPIPQLAAWTELAVRGARTRLWDRAAGFFHSGESGQISWATQIWMVLAGVLAPPEGAGLLRRLSEHRSALGMHTPYLRHYWIEALLLCGMAREAREYLQTYWGGMLSKGADCFWEVYDPEDAFFSPYGSHLVNSYAHSWSCTPAYFIRKYFAC